MSQRTRVLAAVLVLALASLVAGSATSVSWFSDTESADVDVTTATGSFLIYDGTVSVTDGVYTLSDGEHEISVSGWPMKFQVVSGSLTIGESTVSAGGEFLLAIGYHVLTANGGVGLVPL